MTISRVTAGGAEYTLSAPAYAFDAAQATVASPTVAAGDTQISYDEGNSWTNTTNNPVAEVGRIAVTLTAAELTVGTHSELATNPAIVRFKDAAGDEWIEQYVEVFCTGAGYLLGAAVPLDGTLDVNVASVDTDAIDGDAVAASAVTKVQNGLATAAALTTVDNEIGVIDGIVDTINTNLSTLGTWVGDPTASPGNPLDWNLSDLTSYVFQRLDDTVEDNAGTYRFTAAALGQAPSGTGASAATIADEIFGRASWTDVEAELDAVKAVTDQMTFNISNRLDVQVQGMAANTITDSVLSTTAEDRIQTQAAAAITAAGLLTESAFDTKIPQNFTFATINGVPTVCTWEIGAGTPAGAGGRYTGDDSGGADVVLVRAEV
jgi:hypothetical protein